MLEFADGFEQKIGDTRFKKDEEKLVTYQSDGHKTGT